MRRHVQNRTVVPNIVHPFLLRPSSLPVSTCIAVKKYVMESVALYTSRITKVRQLS